MRNYNSSFVTFLSVLLVLLINLDLAAQAPTPTKRVRQPVKLTTSQAKEVDKEASSLFKKGIYSKAFELYTQLYDYDNENMEYNYRLGACYVYTNSDREQAIQYLVKASDKKDAPNDTYYLMGKALLSAGLFDEAIEAFEKYKEVNKGKVDPLFKLEQQVEYCYHAKESVKAPLKVKFFNPGKDVNSSGPEYACVSMAIDTILFFTSNRKGNMGGITDGLGDIIPDIYYSSKVGDTWTRAKNPGVNVNSELYDISSGLNSNGDKLMIYKENGDAKGDIYISEQRGKSWQKSELFHESLETRTPETGACLSNDGKTLYFAAELKGSVGGKDIYKMEKLEGGKWSEPINLGEPLNTPFNEDNPTLWHDDKTLFFASEGHKSIGGYDIFYSSQPDPSAKWVSPINIGYPLNTFDDDLYFALSANAKTGYVSAFKKDGLGDLDIWYFTLEEPLLKHNGTLFRASILAPQGFPAKDAMCMVVKESTGQIMGILSASGIQAEVFILLEPGTYTFTARSAKIGRIEESITVTGSEGEKGINKIIKLEKNPSGRVR